MSKINVIFALALIVLLYIPAVTGVAKSPLIKKGIDVSSYQGKINWKKVSDSNISFVFIRSSMGIDKDCKFEDNYKGAKINNIPIGVYHYYRPNENSIRQANNLINIVKGCDLNFPIVLDIETRSTIQSDKKLIIELHRFCSKVESELGQKPIIYSGDSFFSYVLKDEFEGYELWIADYSNKPNNRCKFWQYSQTGQIDGITGDIDLNLICY